MICRALFVLMIFPRTFSEFVEWRIVTVEKIHLKPGDLVHHYHIAKTGGTTFRKEGAKFVGVTDCQSPGSPQLRAALKNSSMDKLHVWMADFNGKRGPWPHKCGLSSSELRFQELQPLLPRDHYKITIIREPHEWLVSAVYHDLHQGHMKASSNGTVTKAIIMDSSKGYLKRGNKNYQTKWLTGEELFDTYKMAKALASIDVVGITSYFDASLCLIMYKFDNMEEFSKRCSCEIFARTSLERYKSASNPDRFTSVPLQLTQQELTELNADVKEDVQLYTYAVDRFFGEVRFVEKATGQKFLCAQEK